MKLTPRRNILPPAPPLRKLIGPSFILLGLGLGSGEIILWPYLASNYGLGIIWGTVVGITFQFFINMEVERWALINGESIFVGFARWLGWLPLWFILSTFAGFGWPGIGLAGAQILGNALGIHNYHLLGVTVFLLIGLILTLGKVLYNTVETFQKYLILIGIPLILLATLALVQPKDLLALLLGLVGIGSGDASLHPFSGQGSYFLLPKSIALTTFLGALAYSGAGGNLNLAQSFYVKDKGYGMGRYAQKITSILRRPRQPKTDQHSSLAGTTFDPEQEENLRNFRNWWRVINWEHLIVFWALGLFTMLLLALLAYTTTFGHSGTQQGIAFLLTESRIIAQRTLPLLGTLFLLVSAAMLFSTQLGVLETTSRIITENLLLLRQQLTSRAGHHPEEGNYDVSKIFYLVLWTQIIFGIAIFLLGFDEPRALITLGAVLNAFAMFFYIGMILYLNNRKLHPQLRPSGLRNLVLLAAWLFFGFFSLLTLREVLS